MSSFLLALAAAPALAPQTAESGPAAPAPAFEYVFTAEVTVAPPIEQGEIDGDRKRFIAITGGTVRGPKLHGEVLPGGGVRVGSPEVIERLARGERVDPAAYYFRTTPSFRVAEGPHRWLQRSVFVARGVRLPDRVLIDFYRVR